jgi:hypothetical protein
LTAGSVTEAFIAAIASARSTRKYYVHNVLSKKFLRNSVELLDKRTLIFAAKGDTI